VADVCEIVYEGKRAGVSGSSVRPWPRALAVLPGMAAGKPLWVAARWDRSFADGGPRIAAAWKPHIVQAEFSAMGQYLNASGCPRRAPQSDGARPGGCGGERARRRCIAGGTPDLGFSAWRWDAYEQKLLRRADATVVFTDRDRKVMQALHPGARLEQISLGVQLPEHSADPIGETPPMLLFVGNFVHTPNLEAARWLVSEIFPALRARYPTLGLWIVGDNAPAWLSRRGWPGCRAHRSCARIGHYMDRAAVFVAPIRSGGGMRVKVLEALAAGKAVIASPLGMEGLNVEDGVQALIESNTEDFVEAVALLLNDSERRRGLAVAARGWAVENLGWDRCAREYESLHDDICRGMGRAAAVAPVTG
jgi:hypothetical protein